ncbi:hypothetical protein MKW92_003243 [Papaver armeniacum]|nr:hypothetical protein MKW92_003243 [Papaver armeniacum]
MLPACSSGPTRQCSGFWSEWYLGKSSSFSSRNSLRSAHLFIKFEEVQNLLRSATRDCAPLERNSFVSFQASTVCTFTLVLKNAASLLDDKDPVMLETEAILGVADALLDTITSLDKFEQGIKDCLEI